MYMQSVCLTHFFRKNFPQKNRLLFTPSVNYIKTRVRTKSLRNPDCAVFVKVVLKERNQHTWRCNNGVVQSMCQIFLSVQRTFVRHRVSDNLPEDGVSAFFKKRIREPEKVIDIEQPEGTERQRKPLPCSPALAASTAAFKASIFV